MLSMLAAVMVEQTPPTHIELFHSHSYGKDGIRAFTVAQETDSPPLPKLSWSSLHFSSLTLIGIPLTLYASLHLENLPLCCQELI
jgi:hypothetical protein